jgi:hypothetical protein
MTHVARGSSTQQRNIMLRSQLRDTRLIIDLALLLHIKAHLPK